MPTDPAEFRPLAPGVRRVLAPNPSPMTHTGTNTYLVGEGDVTIIDPGPAIPSHLDRILSALGPGERVARILLTHAHRDHSGLARPLSDVTGAPVHAFGTAMDGRSEIMRRLAADGLAGGGEGLDLDFTPDERLGDGDVIGGLTVLHTPGHAASHLCFVRGDIVFSGDTVMGWASTLVSPPDGDLGAFMASTERLAALGARLFFPGHGEAVEDPAARCRWLLDHRRAREAEILRAIGPNGATADEIARRVYTDIPPAMLPAAARNVLAHLIDLATQSRLVPDPQLAAAARYFHT